MCVDETADRFFLEACTVLACTRSASTIGTLRLSAPRLAAALAPGQFVHLRLPALEGHLLRRPFSVYKTNATDGSIDIVFQVVGTGSQHMYDLSCGSTLDALGPLGRGWRMPPDAARVLLIAGGIGAAPLYMLAEKLSAQADVHMVMGAQCEALLTLQDDFTALLSAAHLHICTDDGSAGFHGFTTTRAAELIAAQSFDAIATCGPHLMQRSVAQLAADAGIYCEVSLEERMACGIGACLSCVVDTHQGKQRICVDGPVFGAHEVIWNG